MSAVQYVARPDANRFDPETLLRIKALAARLKREPRERLSAQQLEKSGIEVGLDSEFMRQSLAQIHMRHTMLHERRIRRHASQSAAAALCVPLLFALLAYSLVSGADSANRWTLTALLAPAPIAFLAGALSEEGVAGALAGALVPLLLTGVLLLQGAEAVVGGTVLAILGYPVWLKYVVLAVPVGGLVGAAGSAVRRHWMHPARTGHSGAFIARADAEDFFSTLWIEGSH